MSNTAFTNLELFGIGFGFGLAGPCLLVCAPVLITYVLGRQARRKQAFSDIFVFLLGRLLAYLLLGYLAGLSGVILRRFCNLSLIPFVKALGGAIIILLGIYVWLKKEPFPWLGKYKAETIFSFSSLFMLGFIMGVFPCAPLLALLLEITLISKTALNGMFYALSFGLGTLISGLLVIAGLSGILTWLPTKILKSKRSNLIFRIICALLLIWLGLNLIFRLYPYNIYKTGVVN
jgi:cytochrome c-type biogenesis protein